jgi:hypothetical protein
MLSRALFEYWHIIALGAAMIAWRIWGHHVTASFRRLEQQRARAELQTLYDRANPNSHFRHSVEQINEDTPPVQPDPHQPGAYGWSGNLYHSREDAEAARWHHVLAEARKFYSDLDRQFGNRIAGRGASDTIDGSRP